MSSSMQTILIVGGTGGIGEAFARRWYKQGKKIILTGRRKERLQKIQAELPGTEILVMDNSDLASLPQKVEEILSTFPKVDTVWINSGIQRTYMVRLRQALSCLKLINTCRLTTHQQAATR
jgi:uncharacterized oxidoreductase